jgi:hypothetical protein
VTECQGCGAWNDASRSVCVLCGTSLVGTDEWDAGEDLPPLPPLPDGGLRATMPAWLRELPQATEGPGRGSEEVGEPASRQVDETAEPRSPIPQSPYPPSPLGPKADPRTFLTDDDFPTWLRDLAAREARNPAAAGAATPPIDHPRPPDWPDWPGGMPAPAAADDEQAAAPAPALDGRPPAAVVVARALEERRARPPWETLLLVILFIGVIVAALWALVSNGVFSPSL